MTDAPTTIVLATGKKIDDVPRLKGLLQAVIAAQDGIVAANAEKRSALKALENAGFNKKVAQTIIGRRNRKQVELDLFDDELHAYERALGWRDPDLDLAAEAKAEAEAKKDHIDKAMDALHDDGPAKAPPTDWPMAIHHETGEKVGADKDGVYPFEAAESLGYGSTVRVGVAGGSVFVLQLEDQRWVAACQCSAETLTWGTVLQAQTTFESRAKALDAAARDVINRLEEWLVDPGLAKQADAGAREVIEWMGELLLSAPAADSDAESFADDIEEAADQEDAAEEGADSEEEQVF